jgi:Skp family chaperone for outer membrane proteins
MAKIKRITYVLKNTKIEVNKDCLFTKTKKSIIPRKPYSKKAKQKHYQKHYEERIANRTPAEVKAINKYIKQIANGEWKYKMNEISLGYFGFWPSESCKVKHKRHSV